MVVAPWYVIESCNPTQYPRLFTDFNTPLLQVMSSCGAGSTSIYISDTKPYHLTYDNKEAKEKFGSFYLCGGGAKGDTFGYGDALFYRSADETTPEECGEVIFYPEW